MQPWYNYCDFHRKQGWSCTSIQQLQETMCKIKTEFLLPFVRDGVKSQEYSLRPLCPVETVVKGFSCRHLSGRDIMILQLETESWELFISLNSSPLCAEHIKYHTSKTANQQFALHKANLFPHNYKANCHMTSVNAEPLSMDPLYPAFSSSATTHISKTRVILLRQMALFITQDALGFINSR